MHQSSQLYLCVRNYALPLLLVASVGNYCAPPVGSNCNPSHLAATDEPSQMYPGYIFWPTSVDNSPMKAREQSVSTCVATFKVHGSQLRVASATHCIQNLMLDQLVPNAGDSDRRPRPTIGIAINTRDAASCRSSDEPRLDGGRYMPSLTIMEAPIHGTDHPNAQIDGSYSSVLLPIWQNIHNHFENTDRSEATLADIRAKHEHLIEYFRGYNPQDPADIPIGYSPGYGLKDNVDLRFIQQDEFAQKTNKTFYSKMCSSVATDKEVASEIFGKDLKGTIQRTCFLHTDLMIFDVSLHGKAATWLADKKACMKPLEGDRLKFDLTPYFITDAAKPSLTRFITRLLTDRSSYQKLMNVSADAYHQKLREVFDETTFTDITIHTKASSPPQILNFGFKDKVKIHRPINNLWPYLSLILNHTGHGFRITPINEPPTTLKRSRFAWNRTVIVKQPWGVVVLNNQAKRKVTLNQGLSGSLLITTPAEDKQPSALIAALHSVDGKRTVNGTGIILRVLEDRRNAGATPVPIVNDPPAVSSPPADATTTTSGATTPVPPEQLVGDDGTIVSPGSAPPAPVTTTGEVMNSDDAKAKLAPTHLVDDPQPQAQDFCP